MGAAGGAGACCSGRLLVNGPKEWSILAVLDPDVRAALLRGQVNAERAVLRYLWENGTVQVKLGGRVVRVSVERIEIASVQHFSSRAGDPHFHRHMEISARVWAAGSGGHWTRSVLGT